MLYPMLRGLHKARGGRKDLRLGEKSLGRSNAALRGRVRLP